MISAGIMLTGIVFFHSMKCYLLLLRRGHMEVVRVDAWHKKQTLTPGRNLCPVYHMSLRLGYYRLCLMLGQGK